MVTLLANASASSSPLILLEMIVVVVAAVSSMTRCGHYVFNIWIQKH